MPKKYKDELPRFELGHNGTYSMILVLLFEQSVELVPSFFGGLTTLLHKTNPM
ncbi:hypothetical protein ACVNPX_02945 [Staphylococcus aureus]